MTNLQALGAYFLQHCGLVFRELVHTLILYDMIMVKTVLFC
jgi:hypothetical protein